MTRRDAIGALALFAGLLGVYAAGACPTIYAGDSGELVTAAALLGIPHPSGYPLYVLLGKAWTMALPIGTIAWRLSLFSAACASAAGALLFLFCRRRLDLSPAASIFSALLFAFGPSFWQEATIQRVYALNALMLAAALLAAWPCLRRDAAPRSLAIAFFTCGLGATNHLFMAVFAVCLAISVAAADPSLLRRPRSLLAAAGGFAAGLLPYLYLPLRARMSPVLNWGDPETPGRFLRVIFREGFWERRYLQSAADLLPIGLDFAKAILVESAWAGALLAAVGAWALRKRGTFVLLPLLTIGANFAALAAHGSRTDIFEWHRYEIPSFLMVAILAGAGAQLLLQRAGALSRGGGGRLFPLAAAGALLAIPAALLLLGWRDADRSRYTITQEFSETVLRSMPPGARLIASDDNVLFSLMYLHLVEGRRPDVDLILQGVGDAPLPPLRFDPDEDPVFFTHHPNWNLPSLEVVPAGLTFRAWRAGRPWPTPAMPSAELEGESDPRVPKDMLTRHLIGQFHYMRGVTYERIDWLRAREELAKAAAAAPDNDVLFYNLGLVYGRNGLMEEALAAFERCRAINPRPLASGSHPLAADRIAETRAEIERVHSIESALSGSDALARLPRGSGERWAATALLLEEKGERVAARGARLRALEAGSRR